jgi:FtsJ-like methyltransferase
VPAARRAPFIALVTLIQRRFPALDDPARLINEGAILVNGLPAASPRTRVRADAAIRIRHPRLLRGTIKLAHALATFGIDVAGVVALDLGAAAGGFTQALLDAGAARVYAVDAGAGQLRSWPRADPRVINLERTNLAQLGPHLISEPVNLITMDLWPALTAPAAARLLRASSGKPGPSSPATSRLSPVPAPHPRSGARYPPPSGQPLPITRPSGGRCAGHIAVPGSPGAAVAGVCLLSG